MEYKVIPIINYITVYKPPLTYLSQVYSSRWVVLSVFCLLEMSNALLWVTFAPISDLAQIYFGGKHSYYGSTTSINMYVYFDTYKRFSIKTIKNSSF